MAAKDVKLLNYQTSMSKQSKTRLKIDENTTK